MSQQKQRYLDVLTIRSAQKGTLSAAQAATTSRVPKDYSKLLVEPVVLPDMNHLQVDDAREVNGPCLFYPTGHKNNGMRRSMEDMVRKVHAVDPVPFRPKKTSTVLTAPKRKKVLDPTMPTEPLVYSRVAPETDATVAQLMGRKKINEQNLRMAIRPEY